MEIVEVHPSSTAIKTTTLGIIVSTLLVFVKGIAGYLGHSYALIADATESGADIFSSGLLWLALRIAQKKPDEKHPYGHGKAEPLAAIVVALFLIAAALWIGYHSITFIDTPHELPHKFTLWVLVIVIAVKESLFRYVLGIGKKINSHAVQADAHHHRSDAITSIAAFIGISIALIGGKGYESADDWAALFASGFILYNSYLVFRPALGEIMDEGRYDDVVALIKKVSLTVNGVEGTEKCFIRKSGM